jgi:crossover junction endodeoxyribonuclease RuvC
VGITPQQFEQLKTRVGGAKSRRVAGPVFDSPGPASRITHEVLLGIDPSLRGTGFGVVRAGRPNPTWMAHGVVNCAAGWERTRCLARIAAGIRDVIRQHRPTVCVVEALFYAQNVQTALVMGEARGAALAVVAEAGLPVYEVAPRKVKQSVVGYGGAQKLAVAKMVQRMLNLTEAPPSDAADALALALAHAQAQGRYSLTPARRL